MKLLIALTVLCFVASAMADCGTLERLKVKRQWSQAFGQGGDRETFGLALWRDFFSVNPDARGFFERVQGDNEFSPAFGAHAQRVLGGLDMCISLLDDQATLDAELSHLNGQHADRGIGAENYEILKGSLIRTLADSLGRTFDKASWGSCYDLIVAGISG